MGHDTGARFGTRTRRAPSGTYDAAKGCPPDKGTSRAGFKVSEVRVEVDGHARWLIRLSYKGQFVHLWLVTWMYVVSDSANRPKRRKAPKRRT